MKQAAGASVEYPNIPILTSSIRCQIKTKTQHPQSHVHNRKSGILFAQTASLLEPVAPSTGRSRCEVTAVTIKIKRRHAPPQCRPLVCECVCYAFACACAYACACACAYACAQQPPLALAPRPLSAVFTVAASAEEAGRTYSCNPPLGVRVRSVCSRHCTLDLMYKFASELFFTNVLLF